MATNVERMQQGQVHFAWDSRLPTWLGVLRRGGDGSDLRWFKGPERCATHTMGTFSDGTRLYVDMDMAETNQFPFFPNLDGAPFDPVRAQGHVTRLSVDLAKSRPDYDMEILYPENGSCRARTTVTKPFPTVSASCRRSTPHARSTRGWRRQARCVPSTAGRDSITRSAALRTTSPVPIRAVQECLLRASPWREGAEETVISSGESSIAGSRYGATCSSSTRPASKTARSPPCACPRGSTRRSTAGGCRTCTVQAGAATSVARGEVAPSARQLICIMLAPSVRAKGAAMTEDPRAILALERMTPRQAIAVGLCVLLMALDGFDVLAISFASPGIAKEWGIDRAALGIVMSMEILGMARRLARARQRRRPHRPAPDRALDA